MILVDTSVWIDHLHRPDLALQRLLRTGEVGMHPFVLGEIACGDLRDRRSVLNLFARLPSAPVALNAEVMLLIEGQSLMGRGLAWVDVHLLASVLLGGTDRLWTRDKRLAAAADELNIRSVEE